jgi:NAD dependent epimerase/dehydratase family enzyme
MPWITLEDLIAIIDYAMTNDDLSGPINAVAPNPVTNAEFTKTLAGVLRRPAIIPVPKLALKLLPGGMAEEALLASARVVPQILLERNFGFQYPTLEQAMQHALE